MDGVVDVRFAIEMSKLGGLAVLNLEGVQTRYKNPQEVLQKIVEADKAEITATAAKNLSGAGAGRSDRGADSGDQRCGALAAVSSIPQRAEQFGAHRAGSGRGRFRRAKHGLDRASIFRPNISRSTWPNSAATCASRSSSATPSVTTSRSKSWNAVRPRVLIGVGPGAACTSRGVLGLGVPQVTATVDCAAARDAYFKKTSRYVPIITDGGMSKGGDVCKALACGADAVMVGSAFAKAHEAPGSGYHWGMATPHANLPRGTRIKVGATGSLKQILFGPAEVDDGSQNLVGAITTCMGNVGARNLAEFQQTEIIIAPSIKTEGKLFQTVQSVGMGTR